jgi:biopolymer transport protein ExbD
MGQGLARRRTVDLQEPVINLTPLIDVVFVVLIAFILVAPLLDRDQVQLASVANVPSHVPLSMKEASPIQIHVRADNTILLSGIPTSLEDLPQKLFIARQQFPHAHPQVFHDKRAHFGTYQALKNCLERAGFDEMDIVLSPS